jgi:hypothetical protein
VFSAGWGAGMGSIFGFDRVFVFFGRELAAKFQEAVEIFDGAAMASPASLFGQSGRSRRIWYLRMSILKATRFSFLITN